MTTRNSINRQISLETIYRLIDTNRDGLLTKKELTSALMLNQAVQQELEQLPGMSTRLHPNRLRQAIQDMDMDGDDKGDACDPCPDAANPGAQVCPGVVTTIYAVQDTTDPMHPTEGTRVQVPWCRAPGRRADSAAAGTRPASRRRTSASAPPA